MKDNGVVGMLPWVHTTVSMKNILRPCCRFSLGKDNEEIKPDSEEDIKDKFKWLRKEMLAGNKVEQCNLCYQQEIYTPKGDRYPKSMRGESNHIWNLEVQNLTEDFDVLKSIELSLDNLCNLQCKMCDSLFSSKLYNRDAYLIEEFNKLNIVNKGRKPTKIPKQRIEFIKGLDIDWHALEQIKILGGEPTFSPNFPKLINFLLEHSEVENITIEIVSNCTNRLSQDMIDKLNRFKKIMFTCSLDGCNEYNSYQRWGTCGWKETIINYKWYYANFKNMERHHIHSTYTNLNINGLAADFKYWKTFYPDWKISFNFVTDGEYSPYIVPDPYLVWLEEQWDEAYCSEDWPAAADGMFGLAKEMLYKNHITPIGYDKYYSQYSWDKLMIKIKALDKYYNSKLVDYNPALHEFLINYDEHYGNEV